MYLKVYIEFIYIHVPRSFRNIWLFKSINEKLYQYIKCQVNINKILVKFTAIKHKLTQCCNCSFVPPLVTEEKWTEVNRWPAIHTVMEIHVATLGMSNILQILTMMIIISIIRECSFWLTAVKNQLCMTC